MRDSSSLKQKLSKAKVSLHEYLLFDSLQGTIDSKIHLSKTTFFNFFFLALES
jgi:hypothetical protein